MLLANIFVREDCCYGTLLRVGMSNMGSNAFHAFPCDGLNVPSAPPKSGQGSQTTQHSSVLNMSLWNASDYSTLLCVEYVTVECTRLLNTLVC